MSAGPDLRAAPGKGPDPDPKSHAAPPRQGPNGPAERRGPGPSGPTAPAASELLSAATDGAEIRKLRRNEVLFEKGDPARDLFLVQAGRVGIVYRARDGRESLAALMQEGDVFGLVGLFDGGARPAQARALEQSTVLVLPYAAIRRLLEQRPNLLWSMGKLLTGRLRAVGDTLADTVFLDLTARTAKRILELAGDADDIRFPITQEELAAMVGASRERVNKAIASFVRQGWLEQQGRRYRIRDRDQLAARARG